MEMLSVLPSRCSKHKLPPGMYHNSLNRWKCCQFCHPDAPNTSFPPECTTTRSTDGNAVSFAIQMLQTQASPRNVPQLAQPMEMLSVLPSRCSKHKLPPGMYRNSLNRWKCCQFCHPDAPNTNFPPECTATRSTDGNAVSFAIQMLQTQTSPRNVPQLAQPMEMLSVLP